MSSPGSTIVSKINAQLISQTFFCCNFPAQNYRIDSRTNFCCTFLRCFIQNRSLQQNSPKISEVNSGPKLLCCICGDEITDLILEVVFVPGIYFGGNSTYVSHYIKCPRMIFMMALVPMVQLSASSNLTQICNPSLRVGPPLCCPPGPGKNLGGFGPLEAHREGREGVRFVCFLFFFFLCVCFLLFWDVSCRGRGCEFGALCSETSDKTLL